MKDEIKEILDYFRKYATIRENTMISKIEDCITNLQEELEEEKRIEQASLDTITNLQDTLKDREEYCYGLETQLTNLQEENKRLKEIVENLTTMKVCGDRKQIKNTAQYKLEKAQSRIDKAIEMFDNKTLNKYYYGMSYEFEINDFKEDIFKILKGEDNESRTNEICC